MESNSKEEGKFQPGSAGDQPTPGPSKRAQEVKISKMYALDHNIYNLGWKSSLVLKMDIFKNSAASKSNIKTSLVDSQVYSLTGKKKSTKNSHNRNGMDKGHRSSFNSAGFKSVGGKICPS